jgi:PAS domain S-box-containing protein
VLVVGLVFSYLIKANNAKNLNNYKRVKLANKETLEIKEQYDILVKATSDTIWDWDVVENAFVWNKGIQDYFGYKKEEISTNSKWWFDRIHPEDSIRVSVKLYSFLEQKTERWQDEYRFKCKDGSYKYVLDRGFLVFDEDGIPVRMIGTMQDITKRKEEEQRLKLLETVITNTNDAVVITDSNTLDSDFPKIVFVNEAFTVMSGYDYAEVVGISPLHFKGEKSNSNEIEKLAECIKNKKECEIEIISYKKNGDTYWVQFSMVPVFNTENENTHWISIQRDITERKTQEKEKEELINELTQKNNDLRQFSYITSHNLRAPLSNLIGLLKLSDGIEIENEELKMIFDGFLKSTYMLNDTISDLGKVVIIRENQSIERQNINIVSVLNDVLQQNQILLKNIKPSITIAIKEDLKVHFNKAYLESVFLNLITNALKYKSEERNLELEISACEYASYIQIDFKDNGIGIDLIKNKDKIFGLYQRFHNHVDSRGLGLYLVKSQMESMSGKIEVESEVNKGSTFILKFKTQI